MQIYEAAKYLTVFNTGDVKPRGICAGYNTRASIDGHQRRDMKSLSGVCACE